jgi:hypothetical protein
MIYPSPSIHSLSSPYSQHGSSQLSKKKQSLKPTGISSLPTAPSAVTGNITAIGIGITSFAVSNKFYVDVFGFNKDSRLSFPTWDEDIMANKYGGPVLIPMRFKDERSVKDLPVKLLFAIPDAKATLAKLLR